MLRCTLAVTTGSVKPKIDLGCTQDALCNISDTGTESYCVPMSIVIYICKLHTSVTQRSLVRVAT